MHANASARARLEVLFPLLLPLLAAMVLLPLFAQGCSCGHDISFHLENWLEAARQFRHGTLYPSWATATAFNAGEPRFLFYPPLSWTLGALLTMLFPFIAVPALFTWIAVSASGLSLYFVARRFVSPAAAFLAAALYLANPYMLFTGLERTAFAELLSAAWMPWLFGAALRERPRAAEIAWPLALLWLTNAPAAVMGSYTLVLLGAVRLGIAARRRASLWPVLVPFTGGAALGLAVAAFYLVPAAYERRFVQIAMAIVPGLSVPNNFLFIHTADAAHDLVNHQASHLAITLLIATTIALVLACMQRRAASKATILPAPATTTIVIALLLSRPSLPLWMHLPELAFLQFPWRWLMVLATIAALALAFALQQLRSRGLALACSVLAVAALSFTLGRHYLYGCEPQDAPASVAALFASSHGVPPTDEYTPLDADNDVLRFDSPGYWLSTAPETFASNTIPNPNTAQPDVDFGEPPASETRSTPAPHHLQLNLPQPEVLILNLRDYPNWAVTRNGSESPQHMQRDDGLLAVALPAGASSIDITWRTGFDREMGATITVLALLVFVLCILRSRKIVF